MNIEDLCPGLLVQLGSELLKISSIYADEDRVTAQVMIVVKHPPARTTVRSYGGGAISRFVEPSTQMLNRYDEAYGFGRVASPRTADYEPEMQP